jgi:hypothetical protein
MTAAVSGLLEVIHFFFSSALLFFVRLSISVGYPENEIETIMWRFNFQNPPLVTSWPSENFLPSSSRLLE